MKYGDILSVILEVMLIDMNVLVKINNIVDINFIYFEIILIVIYD